MWSSTISTSATVLMISRCPGDQTRNDCNQVSVRAASESLRVVFVLSVVISVCLARDNPDSGVVVRIAGEGRPWNPGAITGGRVWGDIPDSSVQPGAGNGEPVTAEVLAQRQAEEAIRRETERRADEIVRKMAENKPDLPDGKTELAVRDIAGQERDRTASSERETALPESVLRESQREREAVREVARENLLQERLQQMERDMVRDLQKEKTLGGD